MATVFSSIKLPELPFLKPRDAFAIDLGSSSIKILHLKPTGNKYTLLKWGSIPISEGAVELSPQDRRNMTSARIGEFLAKEKFLLKNVIGSVSGNQVIVRYVKFPKLSVEELSKTIQFEAEPYIPFDIREVNLSFHILGDVTEEGQKKMDTILVAAKKESVQSKLDVFEDLGLRSVVIDIDAFALANAYEITVEPDIAETVVLVNIGSAITNIAIVENHVPRVVRDVFISGNTISKAIQRNLNCDAKAAEDLKQRSTLLFTAEDKEKTLAENQKEALQVSNAMLPVIKDLVSEIHRSVDFYIAQNAERSISRILISGGSANLKNLGAYMNQELKLPVELFNPFKNVAGGEAVPEEVACQFAIAAGLSVRRENDIPKK